MDRGVWQATVHMVAESDMTEQLSSGQHSRRTYLGFPRGSSGKEPAYNAGDLGLIPGLGKSPGGRHGNPLQYSCLENPMDSTALQITIQGVPKCQT